MTLPPKASFARGEESVPAKIGRCSGAYVHEASGLVNTRREADITSLIRTGIANSTD